MHQQSSTTGLRRRHRQSLQEQLVRAVVHDEWQRDLTSESATALIDREWHTRHVGELSAPYGSTPQLPNGCKHLVGLLAGWLEHLMKQLRCSLLPGKKAVELSSAARLHMDAVTRAKAVQFDPNSLADLALLESLWGHTCGNAVGVLTTPDWGSIGFQGKDPSTDLRGLGLFGLRTLERFVREHRELARHLIRPGKLPFAITGLNLIAYLERALRADPELAHELFREATGDEPAVDDLIEASVAQYAGLLSRVWQQFDEFYEKSAARMIADGQPEELCRMHFSSICREYFQQWTGKDLGPTAVVLG